MILEAQDAKLACTKQAWRIGQDVVLVAARPANDLMACLDVHAYAKLCDEFVHAGPLWCVVLLCSLCGASTLIICRCVSCNGFIISRMLRVCVCVAVRVCVCVRV